MEPKFQNTISLFTCKVKLESFFSKHAVPSASGGRADLICFKSDSVHITPATDSPYFDFQVSLLWLPRRDMWSAKSATLHCLNTFSLVLHQIEKFHRIRTDFQRLAILDIRPNTRLNWIPDIRPYSWKIYEFSLKKSPPPCFLSNSQMSGNWTNGMLK